MPLIAKQKQVPGVLTEEGVLVKEIGLEETKVIARFIFNVFGESEESKESEGMNILDFIDEFAAIIPTFTELSEEKAIKLRYSEIRAIWEAFQEVNTDFLWMCKAAGYQMDKLQATLLKTEDSPQKDTETPLQDCQSNQSDVDEQSSDSKPKSEEKKESAISSRGLTPQEYLETKKTAGVAS